MSDSHSELIGRGKVLRTALQLFPILPILAFICFGLPAAIAAPSAANPHRMIAASVTLGQWNPVDSVTGPADIDLKGDGSGSFGLKPSTLGNRLGQLSRTAPDPDLVACAPSSALALARSVLAVAPERRLPARAAPCVEGI
jgi:hypothetical protein